jgi:spoIIIJ-associated protein
MQNQNAGSLDVSAKTVDEAIEVGLARLGLSRQQVTIEIIKEGKRGVFGLGAEEAVVRLTPRPKAPSAAPARPAAKAPAPVIQKPVYNEPEEDDFDDDEPDEDELDEDEPVEDELPVPAVEMTGEQTRVAQTASRMLGTLLRHMGIQARVTARIAPDLVEDNEEPPLVLNITGRDLGILIGRHSETLRALQYMLRLMVSKDTGDWQPVVVDIEDYRIRRRRSLHRMAEKMAERAVASGKRVVLEAMPAYERRVIHVALKDNPHVITKSIGSDDYRKVTIIPK